MALLSATGLAGAVLRPETAAASSPAHFVGPDVVIVERSPATASAVVVVSSHCETDGLTVLSSEDCGR
jgi:hypothetical protein